MTRRDPYKALRHPTYALFLLGSVLDTIGTQMQAVAVGWELYARTHSAMILGLVGLTQFVALLLFALPIGHAADRYDRKLLILGAQLTTVTAAVGLAIVSGLNGPVLFTFVCLFLLGIARSMNMTSRSSLLTALVPREALTNAITWNSNGYQFGTIVGPAVGGILIALTGGSFWVYVIDAISSLAFIGLLLPLKIRPHERSGEPFSLKNFSMGIRFIRKTKLVFATMTLDLFAVLLGGAVTLLPIYATDILHVGSVGLGWLRAAPSAGAILMAVIIAHLPDIRPAGKVLFTAVAGFGVATIVFGLSHIFWLSLLMLFLTGAFDTVSVVIRSTLVQVLTPDPLRGRVGAVNSIFISSSNELGGFESGVTAQAFGTIPSVVLGGIGTIAVVLAVMFTWPQLRDLPSLHEVKPEKIA